MARIKILNPGNLEQYRHNFTFISDEHMHNSHIQACPDDDIEGVHDIYSITVNTEIDLRSDAHHQDQFAFTVSRGTQAMCAYNKRDNVNMHLPTIPYMIGNDVPSIIIDMLRYITGDISVNTSEFFDVSISSDIHALSLTPQNIRHILRAENRLIKLSVEFMINITNFIRNHVVEHTNGLLCVRSPNTFEFHFLRLCNNGNDNSIRRMHIYAAILRIKFDKDKRIYIVQPQHLKPCLLAHTNIETKVKCKNKKQNTQTRTYSTHNKERKASRKNKMKTCKKTRSCHKRPVYAERNYYEIYKCSRQNYTPPQCSAFERRQERILAFENTDNMYYEMFACIILFITLSSYFIFQKFCKSVHKHTGRTHKHKVKSSRLKCAARR